MIWNESILRISIAYLSVYIHQPFHFAIAFSTSIISFLSPILCYYCLAFGGENALEICNPGCYQGGFDQIYREATQYGRIEQFTYLRMNPNLFSPQNNYNIFANFVQRMNNA